MFNFFGYDIGSFFIFVAVVIELIFKGIGLWKSARHESKYWFLAMLIVNSVGILPIIYLLFFEKKERSRKRSSEGATE